MPANNSVKYLFEAVDNMSKNIGEMRNKLKEFEGGIDSVEKKTSTFNKSMTSMSDTFKKVGGQLKYLSVGLNAAGLASLYIYSKLDKGIRDTQNVMGVEKIGAWTTALQDAQKGAIGLGFTIEETNAGLFKTIKEVGANEKAFKIFREAQQLAIGGNTTLEATIEAITKAIDIYGSDIKDTAKLSDSFFRAQQAGDLTIQEMASSFGSFAIFAKNAGVSVEEAIPMFSVLADKMKDASAVTMLMRMASDAVMTPTKQQEKVFKYLGITYGLTKVKQVGMLKVLEQITGAYKKNSNVLALAIPQIKTLAALNNVSAEDFKKVSQAVQQVNMDMAQGKGFTEGFKNSMEGLSQQLKMAKGSVTILGGDVGKSLAPAFKTLLDLFSRAVTYYTGMNEGIKKSIIYYGVWFAILTPLVLVAGAVTAALAAIGSTAAIVVGIIAAVGVVVATVTANWENLTNALKGAYEWLYKIGGLGLDKAFDFVDKLFGGEGLAGINVVNGVVTPKPVNSTGSKNESYANIDLNLFAPKGAVKNYSEETRGTGLNLGVNLYSSEAY